MLFRPKHTAFGCTVILFSLLTISSSAQNESKADSQANLMNKAKALLAGVKNNHRVPPSYKSYGTLGVNYDLENNRPFIWCEKYNFQECSPGKSVQECTKQVKCFPEMNSHKLGCMAVHVFNNTLTSSSQANISVATNSTESLAPSTPTLKGCWSQDENELKECASSDECIVERRSTGAEDRTAEFCCCKTHNCNNKFSYKPLPKQPEPTEAVDPLAPDDTIHMVFSIILVAFLFVAVCMACCLLFYSLRRKLQNQAKLGIKQTSLHDGTAGKLPGEEEHIALIGDQRANLHNIVLLERVSNGRFGQVYRAQLGDTIMAAKIFPATDVDSWVNEQDLYTLKALRSHPNIASFIAAFPHEKKYWLLTLFYSKGSLFEYLRPNVVTLREAARMASSMLNGLAFLHEEIIHGPSVKPTIVHRDLKSKNVLIKDDLSVCIADFGLALKCENKRMTADENHGQVGTRRYMSPELLEGATEFSSFAFQQIDVYAAALVVWEILFRTRIPDTVEDDVPNAMLPYEREVGLNPSLGEIRELVVLRRHRPEFSEILRKNELSNIIIRTVVEMWDMEPDGRITSGCARDRLTRIYQLAANNEQAEVGTIVSPEPAEGANYNTFSSSTVHS
ncbi:protein kinase domain-containing protein [Ditylenchus destructor]|nr:protein kinase domain-containing protein [Ditylenchus destructor]